MNDPISASASDLAAALGTFLSAIHHDGKESRWMRLYEAKKDNPDSLPHPSTIGDKSERAKLKLRKKQLLRIRQSTLSKLLAIFEDEWQAVLVKIGLLVMRGSRWGPVLTFKPDLLAQCGSSSPSQHSRYMP